MINRYYDYEFIELMHMLNKEELCIRHPVYKITNPCHKLISWILLKLIMVTNEKLMEDIEDFVNYTSKTLNRQNVLYRFKNIWSTFMMPLDMAPLHISDEDLIRGIICQWRLKLGK